MFAVDMRMRKLVEVGRRKGGKLECAESWMIGVKSAAKKELGEA